MTDRQVDSVMHAMRVMVALVAHSIAEAELSVTLPQLRVLVMVNEQGSMNLSAVAEGLGVHPSNATRTCNRLVEAGLLERGDHPVDRRSVVLRLSRRGREFVESLMEHRRQSVRQLLRKLPADRRKSLAEALEEFADAAGEGPHEQAAVFGWLQ